MSRRIATLGLATMVVLSGIAGIGLALSSPESPSSSGTALDGADDRDPISASMAHSPVTHGNAVERTAARSSSTSSPSSDAAEGAVSLVSTTGEVTFDSSKNQVLRGESSLPTGSELVVVVAAEEPRSFVAIETTTVGADGTFREELDLSTLPPGATPTVVVYHDGEDLVNATATVTESDDGTSIDARWNRLYVSPGHETISGTTDLAPGTTVTVRVHSAGDSEFRWNETVEVRSDGTFRATFDFGGVEHATRFRVGVYHDGKRLDYVVGTVYD